MLRRMFDGKLNSVGLRGLAAGLAVLAMASCALFPGGRLAAYEVPVLVLDSGGRPVANVEVRSTDEQMLRTNETGLVRMYFISRGLHVLTVRGEGWNTVQSKVSVPMDGTDPVTIEVTPASR